MLALILAAALAAPGAVPFQKELKDWIAVCDNARSCTLKANPADEGGHGPAGIVIAITRKAGPAEQPSVTLYPDDEERFDPKRLRLDGRPLPAFGWAVDDDPFHEASLEGGEALALLRLLRDGRALTLGADKDAVGASLSGAAAAFLAMDDAQGRVGGVTAVARPGPAPASAVARPPPLPVIMAAPKPPPLKAAKALALAVRRARAADLETAGCDPALAKNDEAEPLTGAEAVVILECGMGAYQGSSLVYRTPIANPAAARPLRLPPPPPQSKAEVADNDYVEAEYDPDTATFTSAARGRGIGDCGVSMDWTFDGKAFRPSGLSQQTRCGEPHDWPAVWITKVVKATR